jgi:hypothetical protein
MVLILLRVQRQQYGTGERGGRQARKESRHGITSFYRSVGGVSCWPCAGCRRPEAPADAGPQALLEGRVSAGAVRRACRRSIPNRPPGEEPKQQSRSETTAWRYACVFIFSCSCSGRAIPPRCNQNEPSNLNATLAAS